VGTLFHKEPDDWRRRNPIIEGNNIFKFIGICEIDKTVVVRRKHGEVVGFQKLMSGCLGA